MIIDEEERKKRLERARQISNSINARKNAVNNSNMYTNQEYINRFNRAREISNNINPRKNNTIRTVSQEELAKSEENGKFFMDLIDKNVNSDDSEKTTPIQETGISNKPIENKNEVNVNKLTPEQQKELQNKVKEASNVQAPNSKKTEISIINNQKEKKNWFQANELEDGYQFGDISKTILGTGTDIVQDLATGILSPIENVLDIGTNVVATVQNILGFKDAAKKTRNFADKNITQNVTSEVANASTVGILYNLVNGTPEKIINPAGITYDKDKNIVENYASGLNQFINETGEEQGYENSSVLGTNTDQVIELIGYTLGLSGIGGSLSAKTGTKTIGSSKLGANLSGGNIGLRLGGKTLNLPTLAIAGGMAGGLQEANSKPNVSEVERWTKGFTSGLTEGVTEGIFGFFGVGGNELTDELGKKIASKFTSKAAKMLTNLGFHASGEAIEEFLSYAGNFFADNAIIDNLGNADFSYEWNWADVGEQMLLAFLSTALTGSTAMIVDSNSATKSAEEQLGRKLTQEEKQLVTKAVVDESLNEQIEQMYQNEDIPQKLYVSTFNPDGTIANVEETRGKSINNPNKKVNVQPAIVKTGNDIYTVIDTETGLRLDTTPYNSMLAAEAGFNSKMINLKERDITAINKKVAMSDYSVRDVLLNTAYTIQNDIVQRRNTAQTFQNNNTDVQSNETQNMSSQNDNAVKTNSDVSQTDMSITPDIIESNSELKQNVQTMATNFLDDLSNSTPGQRYKTGDTWTGQKRSTTKELAAIKDNTGASWNQISQSLEEISNGNITTPLSREIVTYIDSALTDGYRNIYGQDVLPSENYVNTKKSLGLYKETQKDSNYGVIDDEDARVFGEKIKRESNIKNQSSNYSDYKELIKNEEEKAISNFNPKVNIEIVEDVKNIKIKDLKQSEAIKIAKKVFNNNNKTKKFNNAELNLKIKVTSDDIKENIHKAFSNKSQKKYIKENISTFSNISSIILNGTKVSESTEQKSRAKYKGWNYFITHAMIDNRPFLIEFDVATQDDGLHFRVERLKEIKIKVDTPLATTKKSMPIQGKSTSINTSISQKNNSVKTNVNNNSIQKIQTLYRKFSRDFHENGYVDLNGRKVSDVKEVADIAQIFRNPNYETFRILYTKGDTIIGQEAVSSRIPGQSNIFKDNDKIKGFYNIKDRMKRLNADGYYMIHNHPSGNAVASQIDIKTTQNFSNRIPGFKAHIIVNSGTYAVIEREKGELSRLTTKNEITIENYKQDDIDKMMSSNPWSDIKIKSNQDIAKLMHDVKNNPNYSTLIMVDDKLFPRIILDIPNNFFSMKRSQIDGYIKNIAKQNGATRAFIATTNNDVYNSTNKLLTITDSILYSVKGNDIIQENTLSKNDENITKQKIFSNSDLRVKKVSTEALGAKAKRNIAIKEEQEKIKKELHNRIQNAILSRNSRKNTYLGNVSNAVVKKVKSLFGIDITNRTHLLADNDIRHMIKQHGNPEIEPARGQIAITSKDIEKIPDILNNYDNIVKGTENKEGNTIRYIKKYSDNVSYVVEVIPTANDTTLYVKTMWKKAINNKKEAVALTNSNNTPSSTSKTRGNLASSNSIAQNNSNVKDNGVRAEKITKTSNNKTLIAQHNTSEEKLLEALDLGALPVPSIAITKYQNPVLKYGDITLLFNKDTINPTDRRNVTYNSDIYSTRKPQIAYTLNRTKAKVFENIAKQNGISLSYIDMIEEYIQNNDFTRAKEIIQYELERSNDNVSAQEVENLFASAMEMIDQKRIMKDGVDPYYPDGSRKSLTQMSIEYNLDNIVKYMTKKSTQGSEHTFSTGVAKIRANMAQKFKSIEEMHKMEKNLVTAEEMEELKSKLYDDFYKLTEEISKYDKIDRYFGSTDTIAEALNEVAKSKNVTIDVLENELSYVSIDNVPKNVLKDAVDFLNSLRNVPTEYFEAKPQRAVGFDEVQKAIVSRNASKEIIDKLESKGIPIEYYSTESERQQRISNSEGVRFEKAKSTRNSRENAPYDEKTHSDDKNFINNIKDNNYLKTLLSVDNSKGATNAQSSERLIEQEIELVESMGAFDNNIPVTKLTDIRKTIENYLGKKLLKGHFREHAYGIYKTKNDFIRVKELKDIDNILHEVGHALDLGQRVTINKETLQDELLKAVERHGGYENDTKTVQLEEGWAEVVRVYIINQSLAEKLYPKTASFIDNVRQQDKSINDFLTRVQNQLYNYIHQNPRNRILSNMSIGEQTDKEPMTPSKFKKNAMRLIYDKDYLLKATVNDWAKMSGKKPSEIDPSRNAYILTRLASGVNNKAVSMISDGYIDVNGDKLMPGLNKLGDILNNDPQRFNDLRAYLVAKRDLEYKAKSLKTGIRTLDSKAVVKQFENDIQVQEAAQIVYDTLNGVLQYAVNNGLITQENADTIKESNTFYVPFQRVVGKNQVGRRGAVSEIIKGRTGSELDIKDVLENIVVNSANIIQQVENNNVLRALYEQGEELGMQNAIFDVIPAPVQHVGTATLSTWESELKKQGVDVDNIDLEKTIDIFAPNNKIDQENRITSFIDTNGNRVYLQFTEQDIFNSIMALDKNSNSWFLKLMSKLNMPLRYGATMANIGFAIPNMIADTAQAAIYSEAGFIPVIDNVIGILDILAAQNKTVKNFVNKYAPEYAKKIEYLYNIYQQSGASSSTRLSQYRKSSQEIMKDIYGTKNSETLGIKESFKPLKRLLDIMTYIPELSEQSTRFRVFERNYEAYKNKGGSEIDARTKAAIESRDATQDFGRTGTAMREINQLIPFSAARVGSVYTFSEKVTQNTKKTMSRIALLSVLAMLIKAIGYDDKEIEELNQRKKSDNFVLNIGGTIVTIKKPQGVLRSILSLEEYILDLATGHIEEGKEGEMLGKWLETALMDNLPADEVGGLVPNAIAPIIENAYNKDFYYNSDIVKSYDLDLPDSQQYYDYTSQLAIALGKIFDYSPAKIDNLISGYFGGLGTQVTNIIDNISGKLGLSVEKPAMGIEDNTIGKRFVVNVNENSASIDEVYTLKDELTKKLNGGTITSEENKQLETLKQATSDMAALNKQIKAIKKDLTMSGTEKADKIRPLQEQKTDVARKALGKDPISTTRTSDLDSLQFYPSRDVLSKSNYTLSLTEEMKKEYEKLAYSQYQKYKKQGIYSEEYLDKLKSKCKDYAKSKMMQKYKNKLTKNK